ncbi:MAG: hypothetical protein A3F68_11405 [Acidobacteria bacterium RIFCSPLOWO2_12_FULL_54_10]|nr:MAG: hypothetical protein A3F68_11405 [Acidobacteria bacterium RIFCSPLOWO2_12_FULL_54_10]
MKYFLHDCWYVCWRELLHFLRSKVSVLASIFQPLVWLLLVGNIFQGTKALPGFPAASYVDFMTPGVLVMVSLFSGSMAGMTVIWDRRVAFLSKLLALPISRASIVVGKMLSVAIRTSLQILIVLGVAMAMGVRSATGIMGIPVLLLIAVLLTFAFSGVSITVGALVKQPETFWAVVNFMTAPMLFMSSALFPLELVPNWLRAIALLNPVTHAINPIRTLMLVGWDWQSVIGGLTVVIIFSVIVAGISTYIFVRRVDMSTL